MKIKLSKSQWEKIGNDAGWIKTAWIGEDIANGFIITGQSGPQTKFFCSSPTQGEKMIPNAQSLAYVFPSYEEANMKLDKLKLQYSGILNWTIEEK